MTVTERQTTGQRIAELRRKSGMSQEDLGKACGVSRQSVSKWESDAAFPDIDNLVLISRLFSVSVDELLGLPVRDSASAEQPLQDVLEKYSASLQKDRRRNRCLIGILAALLGLLSIHTIQIARQVRDTTALYTDINHQMDTLSRLVSEQEGRMNASLKEFLDTAADTYTAGSGYSLSVTFREDRSADVSVSLMPRYTDASFVPELYALSEDERVGAVSAVNDDFGFKGIVHVPAGKEWRFFVRLPDENGNAACVQIPDLSGPSVRSLIKEAGTGADIDTFGCSWIIQENTVSFSAGIIVTKDYPDGTLCYGNTEFETEDYCHFEEADLCIEFLRNGSIFQTFRGKPKEIRKMSQANDFFVFRTGDVLINEGDVLSVRITASHPNFTETTVCAEDGLILKGKKPVRCIIADTGELIPASH